MTESRGRASAGERRPFFCADSNTPNGAGTGRVRAGVPGLPLRRSHVWRFPRAADQAAGSSRLLSSSFRGQTSEMEVRVCSAAPLSGLERVVFSLSSMSSSAHVCVQISSNEDIGYIR